VIPTLIAILICALILVNVVDWLAFGGRFLVSPESGSLSHAHHVLVLLVGVVTIAVLFQRVPFMVVVAFAAANVALVTGHSIVTRHQARKSSRP
jgi:hypothetical protein